MVKILINNTSSALNLDLGVTVPANGQLTIQPTDYLEAADNDELVELIGDGTLTINDGNEDLTKAQGMALIQSGFRKTDFDDSLLTSNRLKVDVTGTLSSGTVKVSDNDTTADVLDSKITSANSILTTSIINASANEELQLTINSSNINTADLNNDANFINSSEAPVQPSDLSDFETSTQLNARDTNNRNRANHTGTQLASTISDFTTAVQAAETDTTLSFNNTTKILSYTNEAGTTSDVDLNQFLDNTNLAQIVSGVLNSSTGIVTFTRDDNSTFTVDFSSLNDQAAIVSAISAHETTIDNHNDVDVTTTTPSVGDSLVFDGSNWVPSVVSGAGFKDYVNSSTSLANQTNNYDDYISLSTTIPSAGLYKISWSYTWSINTTNNDFLARVQVDNSTTIFSHQQEAKDSAGTGTIVANTSGGTTNTSTNQKYLAAGFDIVSLTAGGHTIDLDFAGEVNNLEPTIYRAILTIEEW